MIAIKVEAIEFLIPQEKSIIWMHEVWKRTDNGKFVSNHGEWTLSWLEVGEIKDAYMQSLRSLGDKANKKIKTLLFILEGNSI